MRAALADNDAQRAALEAARAETAKKQRGLFSPAKIVEAVEAALDRPFDDGLRFERELFLQCIDSPQRAGLIHAFFAEREVVKAPETKAAKPRAIASAGIVGGGTMGAGIAVAMLDAGPAGDDGRARRAQPRARPRQRREGLRRPGRQGPHERRGKAPR